MGSALERRLKLESKVSRMQGVMAARVDTSAPRPGWIALAAIFLLAGSVWPQLPTEQAELDLRDSTDLYEDLAVARARTLFLQRYLALALFPYKTDVMDVSTRIPSLSNHRLYWIGGYLLNIHPPIAGAFVGVSGDGEVYDLPSDLPRMMQHEGIFAVNDSSALQIGESLVSMFGGVVVLSIDGIPGGTDMPEEAEAQIAPPRVDSVSEGHIVRITMWERCGGVLSSLTVNVKDGESLDYTKEIIAREVGEHTVLQ